MGRGDRTYKLHSGITSEYGRYVKSLGDPVADWRRRDHRSPGTATPNSTSSPRTCGATRDGWVATRKSSSRDSLASKE